jgi:hypothetical protein
LTAFTKTTTGASGVTLTATDAAWSLSSTEYSNAITNGITFASTDDVSITSGSGGDALDFNAIGGADITLAFAATATGNGADTVTNFVAGASGDKLNFEAFLSASGTNAVLTGITATSAATINNKVTLVAKTALADTTDLAAADFAVSGTAFASLADGNKGVVIVSDVTGGAKIYYVYDSNAASPAVTETITLVGTLTSVTSGFHADNFVVA